VPSKRRISKGKDGRDVDGRVHAFASNDTPAFISRDEQ